MAIAHPSVWENYLFIGCDGKLTPGHKCRKLLVWIENEEDEDADEYHDEEPVVDPPLSTESSLPPTSCTPDDTPSPLLPEISENDQPEAVDEQNLFDEMLDSMKEEALEAQKLFGEMPTSEKRERSIETVKIQNEIGNELNSEVTMSVITSKHESTYEKNFVSSFTIDVENILMKVIEIGDSFSEEVCYFGQTWEDEFALSGFVHDRGKENLVFDEKKTLLDRIEFHEYGLLPYCRNNQIELERIVGCISQILNLVVNADNVGENV